MSKLYLKPNPTLHDIQAYVRQLEAERGFAADGAVDKILLLTEEVGELCKVVRKSHTAMGMDASKTYNLDAAGEIADIIIVLAAIANRLDVDMEQAFRDKEEKNKQRTWR